MVETIIVKRRILIFSGEVLIENLIDGEKDQKYTPLDLTVSRNIQRSNEKGNFTISVRQKYN